MSTRQGPVIFASIYTVGVVTTYALVAVHDRIDAEFVKFALPVFQILITTGAIFSAWALQNHKRNTDAADAARATADAVLAVIISINGMGAWVVDRVGQGRKSKTLFGVHANLIEEELKVLSGVALSALSPSKAAVALVRYRQFARQFVVVLRRYEEHATSEKMPGIVEDRFLDVRLAEKALRKALGRKVPKRLKNIERDKGGIAG